MIAESTTRERPSRAFAVAAALGVVAALPGLAYVAIHLGFSSNSRSLVTDVLFLLGIGAIGPLAVLGSVARMMSRPHRPVGAFLVSLVTTSVVTVFLLALSTFAPSSSEGIFLLGLLGGLCGAAAFVIASGAALVAAFQRRATGARTAS